MSMYILQERKIAVESQGSQAVFIPGDKYKTPEGEPLPLIVQKSDGVSEGGVCMCLY